MKDDGRQCKKNYIEFPQLDLSKMGILPFICSITHTFQCQEQFTTTNPGPQPKEA